MKIKKLDTVVIGSGLSALSFSNEFLKRNKKINIISFKNKSASIKKDLKKLKEDLPPQIMSNKSVISVYKFLKYNSLKCQNADVIGSMDFGGFPWRSSERISQIPAGSPLPQGSPLVIHWSGERVPGRGAPLRGS